MTEFEFYISPASSRYRHEIDVFVERIDNKFVVVTGGVIP